MRDKLYETVLGAAIGDALGVPVEFKSRNYLKENFITDYIGYGTWNQPLGTWSDDTAMILAEIDALNKNHWQINKQTLNDMALNFCDWLYKAKYCPNGSFFDCGNTTKQAVSNYKRGKSISTCGVTEETACGNGSLMRICCLAFVDNITPEDISLVGGLTHNNKVCNLCCILFVTLLNDIYKSVLKNEKDEYFNQLQTLLKDLITDDILYKDKFELLLRSDFKDLDESVIKSGGFVLDTLIASLWCFLNTDSYSECVLKAVNLGGDTDTTACVAGALAGLYYGLGEIPTSWETELRDVEQLRKLCYNE